MADLTNSDVSVSLDARDRHILGKLRMSQGSFAFGDGALTYPYGGVPMPAIGNFGMNKEVSMLGIVDASGDGLIYRYDQANRKVKIFTSAPPIVYEEVVTVTDDVGYLKYPAAHIEYVTDDTDDYRVIPGGLTPIAKSVSVDMGFNLTTGVLTRGQRTKLTFLTADTVTSCKVSYITQAWKEVADNMVQACITAGTRVYGHADMSFTAGTPDVIKLGEDYVAMQSVCWDADGTYTPMSALQDDATLTAASTECVLDFRKSSTFGEASFHQTDAVDTAGHSVYFNYIKDPGAGFFLYDRFTNAAIDDSDDTLSFTDFPLIACTCGGIPMELTTKKCLMTGVNDTVAAGEGKFTSHAFLLGVAPTHQHDAITAGTPAGSVAAPTFTGSQLATHQHAVITAGTPAGTNGASVVTPGNHATVDGVTVGTPKLLHHATPTASLAANALYIVEAYGVGNKNVGVLQSNCASSASILGSTDDVSGAPGAATPRFFVTHNATPAGVAIYVDEADNDKLVFISPTETDAIVIMPFEGIASGVPGYAYAVTVHHKASMSGCSALFFDDNGAADNQLVFVEDATADRVIYASDIEVLAPQYTGITGNCGSAAAQTFTGAEMGTHQHDAITAGTPAGSNSAPTFTGSQLATHQHDAITAGTPAGSNSAPAFTGSAMSTHQHASATVAPVITMHSATDDDSMPAWIAGDPSEIQTIPIELSEDTIIQSTTLKFMAWGR